VPTNTPTATPLPPTPTATKTPVIVNTIAPCSAPAGWVTYAIQRGDTLLKIAQARGTSIEAIQAINCLTDINNIYVGQNIFVPQPLAMSPSTSFAVEGCTDANVQIASPTLGQLVSGTLSVQGTAADGNFALYKLEIRPSDANVYTLYNNYVDPVAQGELGQIDTRIFNPGIYWIKLTVIRKDNQTAPSCAVPVLFGQ